MDAKCFAQRFAVWTLTASSFLAGTIGAPEPTFAQQAAAAEATASPENISRWTSRQRSFEIPFQLAEDDTTTVVELYSSYNGEAWKLYERRRGNDGKFIFKADRDGAYWFTSRTIDAQNRPHPTGPLSAELLVIVDATPPQVDFELKAEENGALQCSWNIEDPGLAPQSLKLEYEVAGTWKPVAVQLPPQQMQAGVTTLKGGVTWRPESPITSTNVRLSISDAAGNLSQPSQPLTIAASPAVPAAPATASASAPAGNANQPAAQSPAAEPPKSPSAVAAAVPWRSSPASMGIDDPAAEEIGASPYYNRDPSLLAESVPTPSANGAGSATKTASSATNPAGGTYVLPAPNSTTNKEQVSNSNAVANDTSAYRPGGSAASPYQPNASPQSAYSPSGQAGGGAYKPNATAIAETPGSKPWYAEDPSKPEPKASVYGSQEQKPKPQTAVAKTAPVAGPISPAVTARASQNTPDAVADYGDLPVESTNATTFQLDYDVEAVGPGGVAKVELWITRNRGQHWEQYSEDPDLVSPIEVQITSEGLYGFRVQVTGKNGLGAQPPKSGDQADIWIDVDTVKPVVALNNVPYGSGPTAGKLEIYWTAEDTNLAQRPVTLRYSESATGPWTTIAASIPNDGKYLWAIEASTPKEVYLRLEVTDRAGNVGVAQLADPVRLQPLIPKARIRGFTPVSKVSLGTSQQTALLR